MQNADTPILNDIARNIVEKGGIVDVYRVGRGVIGAFRKIEQANGRMDYSVQPPRPFTKIMNFWCVHHSRGTEMLIQSAYDNLEIRKIQPNVFHVIIPA